MSAAHPSANSISGRRLWVASALALLAAVAILVVIVLPAEFAVDPLGTGRALGLMLPETGGVEVAPASSGDSRLRPAPIGPAGYYPAPYATDTRRLQLGPYEYVEYKYRLEEGASMTFAWRATAPVLHDFHAEPDHAAEHTEVSFDARPLQEAFGTHTAPMSGLHGWMWENPGGTPITVTLSTAGFYSSATEFRPNRRTVPHAVRRALE